MQSSDEIFILDISDIESPVFDSPRRYIENTKDRSMGELSVKCIIFLR